MQRLLIHLANAFVLIVVLIGVPAAASRRLLGLQLTSVSTTQMLTLWGLGLMVAANFFVGIFLAKDKKLRRLCLKWMLLHAVLFLIEALLYGGYIDFVWLKQALLWLKQKAGEFL
jgi:hypothetical protein